MASPLVIGLDDLQWADPSSFVTIDALHRRLAYLPAAIICCLRPLPRGAELNRLIAALEAAGGRPLSLHALTDEAVTELVTETVEAQPSRALLAEIRGAAGNPLFVTATRSTTTFLSPSAGRSTGRRGSA